MLSALVIAYLFLGGIGAGLCFVLAVLGLLSPAEAVTISVPRRSSGRLKRIVWVPESYRRLFVLGYAISAVALLLGIICLLADIGRIDQILFLLMQPTLSFIGIGAWVLGACLLVAVVLGAVWSSLVKRRSLGFLRVLGVVSGILALAVMLYTGLLLQSLQAVPLWATPWLPILFVLSSLSCGIALMVGSMQFTESVRQFGAVLKNLLVVDIAIIALEVVAVIGLLTVALFAGSADVGGAATNTDRAAQAAAWSLLTGEFAGLFWGGFVVLGLAVPCVVDAFLSRSRRPIPALGVLVMSISVLVGGLAMRFCIVSAGMHPLLLTMPVG